MALTKRERKLRLRRGAQREIALELGVSEGLVSLVMNGKTQILGRETVRTVREAIAAKIGAPVEEVFGTAA